MQLSWLVHWLLYFEINYRLDDSADYKPIWHGAAVGPHILFVVPCDLHQPFHSAWLVI